MANEALVEKLKEELNADHVDIIDNSWMHAGHAAVANGPKEGTHLSIVIVSPKFEGVSLLNRHRMVHEVLEESFKQHLHALELKAYTPSEWQSKVTA